MSESLTNRIKHWNEQDPNYIIEAFSSDLHEIVKRAETAEVRAAQLQAERDSATAIFNRVLPLLKEDIAAIGDDHSVGICCYDVIHAAEDIDEWLHPEKKAQREQEQRNYEAQA